MVAAPLLVNWPLRIMYMSSTPASPLAAALSDPKSLHWPSQALDRAMVLLDYVDEVFHQPDGDWDSSGAIDFVDPGLIGAALIHRDLLRRTVLMDGLSMKRLAAAMS
nr:MULTISPECIES: hypothetical protein [unclassified Massilia]